MTTREIQGHLEEIYSTKVSAELISKVTDGVLEDIINWQNRPLDSIYPIIYLDCIYNGMDLPYIQNEKRMLIF
ncbi:transposase [Candidatus Tisiphia endosymbiont of Thecophora atra]|uniref:transposase n=1 Tax=Candidatus Tisiphia endosymbiont of Thecophora atra TaxID=3066258 RepID=UPI00312CB5A7